MNVEIKTSKKSKYDVAIIGAGISGLIAGAYLAKNGLRVIIVERNKIPGGCYSSFKRHGFYFDSAAQIIGSCGKNELFGTVLNDLEVDVDLVKLNMTDIIHFPNEKIFIDGNCNEFSAYLENRFKNEREGISNFFEFIKGINSETKAIGVMRRYAAWTYQDLLNEYFKDDILKSIFSAQAGYLGLPPKQLSAVSSIFFLRAFLVDGAYYPKGGSQALSDALESSFKRFGGEVLFNSEVKKIITKGSTAYGVLCADVEINADQLIVASDLIHAYKKLIGMQQVKPYKKFYKKITTYKIGDSCCILYLGISKEMNLADAQGWYYPSYDINKYFKRLINIHIATHLDKTLAKNANKIAIATFPFEYEKDRGTKRQEFKKILMQNFLHRIEKNISGIGRHIMFKELATPRTIERYTLNAQGSLYGWAQSPDQTHQNCFPMISPFNNVVHAGHWTMPGGGVVAVAASGISAAKKVLKKRDGVAHSRIMIAS